MYLYAVTVLNWSVTAYRKEPQHVSLCSDSVEVVSNYLQYRSAKCD